MTKDKNILIHNIYYMLAYAFRYFRFNTFEYIRGEKFDDAQNLLAEILIRSVSSQLKQGLYKTYADKEGALSAIRGRVDMLKTWTIQHTNPYRVYCKYDEHSVNNPYNQVIKTTLQCLAKCSNVEEGRKQKIRSLLRFFASIDTVNMKLIHVNQFRFDWSNQNYQFMIYICFFIFQEMLMTTENGDYKLCSLSDDRMEKLFEKFVLEYYKRHYPELDARCEQIDWNIEWDETSVSILPRMKTDVKLTIGKRTLIIDTKYHEDLFQRNFDTEKIRNSHIYQIRTYVSEYDKDNTGLVDGMLLYAMPIDGRILHEQMKMRTGNTIYFRTLDLNKPFEDIERQLASFVSSSSATRNTNG